MNKTHLIKRYWELYHPLCAEKQFKNWWTKVVCLEQEIKEAMRYEEFKTISIKLGHTQGWEE